MGNLHEAKGNDNDKKKEGTRLLKSNSSSSYKKSKYQSPDCSTAPSTSNKVSVSSRKAYKSLSKSPTSEKRKKSKYQSPSSKALVKQSLVKRNSTKEKSPVKRKMNISRWKDQ